MHSTASAQITTRSGEETQELGAQLGALLSPGLTITLSGELGAGKTTLVKGIARGNGYNGHARSPTFVLICEYSGNLPIAHCDMYRLQQGETDELGLQDYLEDGVLLVEWPERQPGLASADGLHCKLEFGKETDQRRISISARGAAAAEILATLNTQWSGR